MRSTLLPLLVATGLPVLGQRFYSDDPIWREPTPRRVEEVKRRKLNDYYDLFLNTFAEPGERHRPGLPIRAQAVNTLGEVPDSAWYTNRHASRRMSMEELVRGPVRVGPPDPEGNWSIIGAKTQGITPGFTIRDVKGRTYFLKFDPRSNPEMSTGADVIGSKLFHALGYNVPENHIVRFNRERLVIDSKTTVLDNRGKLRPFTDRDLTETLLNIPVGPNGEIRAVASFLLPGRPVGEFRYHSTRRDDPNDVVPHEHRRDLRGLFVFCAWLGHDDSRAINTLDMLVDDGPNRYIRHHLIDFGSILGSASTSANSARSGNAHLFQWGPSLTQLFTLGLWVPRWARVNYPDFPSIGLFESRIFEPEKYRTEYPNPAFYNRLPDDTYWAAKQVMAFSDEEIRAVVRTAQYGDAAAERYLGDQLIARRDKIGRVYLETVLPLDQFEVRENRLTFTDLAVQLGFSKPRTYTFQWSLFNNLSQQKTTIPGRTTVALPPEILSAQPGAFFAVVLHAGDTTKAVTVYLRKKPEAVEVVGIDRAWKES